MGPRYNYWHRTIIWRVGVSKNLGLFSLGFRHKRCEGLGFMHTGCSGLGTKDSQQHPGIHLISDLYHANILLLLHLFCVI